ELGTVQVEVKVAKFGWQIDHFDVLDQFLAGAPELDEVGDGADLEPMFAGEPDQLGQARHGAVVAHDFANDSDGPLPGELDQVDGRFGVAGPLEDAARARAQRENVAGLHEVFRNGRRLGHNADGFCTVRRTDTCGNAVRGIDTDLEIGFEGFAV